MKLYRIKKEEYGTSYNHLFIDIISDKNSYGLRQIFTISWQQNKNDTHYYGYSYNFNGAKNDIKLFYLITKHIEKSPITNYDIQPYEMIELVEKLGYRHGDWITSIGYIDFKKLKNVNYNLYNIHHKMMSDERYLRKTDKKKYLLKNDYSIDTKIEISEENDKIKNSHEYDIKSLQRECILYKGTDIEKQTILRTEKLKRILVHIAEEHS